jgi:hypothetical protein
LVLWIFHDEKCGGFRKTICQLIEPANLAPGQPSGASGDLLLCLSGGKVARDAKKHLLYADGFADRGIGLDA